MSTRPKTDFNLFKSLVLVDTERLRNPKATNPTGETIRVMSNGAVYPSQELVEKYNLEYKSEGARDPGNGIDVIDSADWDKFKDLPRAILMSVVPKNEPKIELFSSCRRTEEGTPMSSVMNQGTKSALLLKLVTDLGYLTSEQKYCDLALLTEFPITAQDGILHVPKVVERGERKGEKTYVRRENITFYPTTTVEELAELTTVSPDEVVVTN